MWSCHWTTQFYIFALVWAWVTLRLLPTSQIFWLALNCQDKFMSYIQCSRFYCSTSTKFFNCTGFIFHVSFQWSLNLSRKVVTVSKSGHFYYLIFFFFWKQGSMSLSILWLLTLYEHYLINSCMYVNNYSLTTHSIKHLLWGLNRLSSAINY